MHESLQVRVHYVITRTKEYQEKILSLSKELEDVRGRLLESEKQAAEPQPLLIRLQEDIKAMKVRKTVIFIKIVIKTLNSFQVEHELSLSEEQKRASDAELKLQQQAKLEEERVASLEAKLSELSEIVGKYDKQRNTDQQAIQ